MMRNHLIDPESSPSKGGSDFPDTYEDGLRHSGEDPWYSGRESPQAAMNYAYSQPSYGQPYPAYSEPAPMQSALPLQSGIDEDFENEPPLLEELGIRFDHIWEKTQAVIHPTKQIEENILDDADLAGPLFFCLLMGSCLLLSGKVHFGYIYGFSVFGCFGMHTILNLLHTRGIDFWLTCSVLGYCLLPVIGLAGTAILLKLRSLLGILLSAVVISWSTYSATRLFNAKMGLSEQYWLVAYPIMLLYSCFVIITIF